MCRSTVYLLLIFILLFPRTSVSVEAEVDYVLVKKSDRKLLLLSNGKPVREYRIALGANPKGHKHQEGDRKTPEGIYLLDYKKEDSAFFRAIHISYPDADDIARAEATKVDPGGQIMIHGQKNGFGWLARVTQSYNWTDGCIAVTDEEMAEIWEMVKEGTPIEIQR